MNFLFTSFIIFYLNCASCLSGTMTEISLSAFRPTFCNVSVDCFFTRRTDYGLPTVKFGNTTKYSEVKLARCQIAFLARFP